MTKTGLKLQKIRNLLLSCQGPIKRINSCPNTYFKYVFFQLGVHNFRVFTKIKLFRPFFFFIWKNPWSFNFPLWNRSSPLFILCCSIFQCECPSLNSQPELAQWCIKNLSSGFFTFSSISLAVLFLIDTMDITVCEWSDLINGLLMPLGHISSPVDKLAISNDNLSYLILLARSSI